MAKYVGLIAYQGHCSTAALVEDGRLISAVSEERYSRIKEDSTFPGRALATVLKGAKCDLVELDGVFFAWNPYRSLTAQFVHAIKHLPGSMGYVFKPRVLNGGVSRFEKFRSMLQLRRTIANTLGHAPSIRYLDHHLCHSVAAYAQSGFKTALSVIIDGCAEKDTAAIYEVRDGKHNLLRSIPFPHSVGMFYSAVTQYLGFRPDLDEYKVMGLAAWGSTRFVPVFKSMFQTNEFRLDLSYFRHHVDPVLFYGEKFVSNFGDPDTLDFQTKADIARGAQESLTTIVQDIVQPWCHAYRDRVDGVCFSGGVFQNCSLNQRLRDHFSRQKLFFSPLSSDLGTAVGAAYMPFFKAGEIRPIEHLYWGPSFVGADILHAIQRSGKKSRTLDNPTEVAARLLAEGAILGWFQGRTELGPRALGNRSILADPRRKEMKERLNECVKQRELFRPFAPSVLAEKASDYFDLKCQTPRYMIETFQATALAMKTIPAVIHVDGTSRVQAVTHDQNPLFHELISRFDAITGVPVLLNTSFNVNMEPMVNTPEDALRCFDRSGLDYLIMGDQLIRRET